MEEGGTMLEEQIKIPPLFGSRAEVGLMCPVASMLREYEILAPEGVRFSRAIMGVGGDTTEDVKKMAHAAEIEARKLNIYHNHDLICFACTMGSFMEGVGYDQKLIDKIEKASGSTATTTSTCVVEVFKDMGVKKIALVGPYVDFVLEQEVKFFKGHDIDTIYVKGLGIADPPEYWEYQRDPYNCYELIKNAARTTPSADCIFVSCMLSNILGWVDGLERQIGKPIVSSSSATLYGILKKLVIPDLVYHYGEVLTRPRLPEQVL
jgi:maleate isomerase